MAFPFVFAENFEAGTRGNFDSESDSDAVLDFPHYSTLAKLSMPNAAPYSGAYCVRIRADGGTADATLTEADINIADTVTNYFHFNLFIGDDFDATANDTVALLELKGAAAAVTVAFGFRYVASTDVINLGVGGANTGAVPDNFAAWDVKRNTWYTIELTVDIETDGSGTIDLFATEEGKPAQTTADATDSSLTNIAVTDGVFGLQDHLSTTTGTILLDNFIQDDARIYPRPRFGNQIEFTQSGHAFVGRGDIAAAALLTDEATNKMELYDTDTADTNQGFKIQLELDNQTSVAGPVHFEKGCYVSLSGTDPRGQVLLVTDSDVPGSIGPTAHSPAGIRRHGSVRN